jgi:hypothetical protein
MRGRSSYMSINNMSQQIENKSKRAQVGFGKPDVEGTDKNEK